jgi:hypothetical protein
MALPVTIPNEFANATTSIPLSQLDTNFTTLANAVNGISDGSETLANVTATVVNATTVDTTNIQVTNIKAKDGTAAGSIADSTGVVTLASSVLTTTDINGGTIDGAVIGGASAAAGSFTTLNTSGQVVFNDAGADVDFRVEGDTEANLLFVDASAEAIGIGTNSVTGFGTAYRVVEIVGPSGNGAAVRLRGGGDAAASEDALIYKVNGSSGSLVLRNYANGRIVFMANNANVVEFQTGGAVTLKGATDTANGTGITFPDTWPIHASSDANTLDDYEEGSWTPTVNNMTTTGTPAYGGTYRKIGSQVTIWFFTTSGGGVATYTATAGSTSVSGLPFTSSFGGVAQSGAEPGVYTNGSTTAGGFLQGPGGGTSFFFSSSMSSSQGVTASLTYVTT